MKKRNILFIILSLIIIASMFFSSMPVFANDGSNGKDNPQLEKARKTLEDKIIGIPGIAGIAHSENEGDIIVFLEDEPSKGKIPDSIDGFAVRKLVTGRFMALGTQLAETIPSDQTQLVSSVRTGSVSPLVGGISLSAYISNSPIIYAGTLGMVTYDNKILTNAHVIAMDPSNTNFLKLGTPVIQPGSIDGGTSASRVGTLNKYVSIRFGFSGLFFPNYVDAAIAAIDNTISTSPGDQYNESGNYNILGSTTVAVNDTVRKSGRTTDVTTGTVASTNASVIVYYSSNKWAYFTDQILINQTLAQPFIGAGDSGSAVWIRVVN